MLQNLMSQQGRAATPSVCFCSMWERTESWVAIGEQLAERGMRVFHIVTPSEYRDLCIARGVPVDQVLWLRIDEALAQPLDTDAVRRIAEYEQRTSLSLKHFLMMDRFLRERSWDEVLRYAAYCFRRIEEFLDRHRINFVSGEPTGAHDLVALLICRATGRHYGAPFDIRFPVQRFAIWNSDVESSPLCTGAPTPADVSEEEIAQAREVWNQIRERKRMPFLTEKAKAPGFGKRFMQSVIRGVAYRSLVRRRHDGHMYSLWDMLTVHKYHMIPVNHRLNRAQWKNLFELPEEGERFVLFTLNYQPEHSIDVEAPHWTNQYEVAKALARCLPIGVRLYVKEHPSALGLRGPSVLRRFKRLPGVRLIDPRVDSHGLLQRAELVACITGTIAMEAAAYGKHAAVLGSTFMDGFSTVTLVRHPSEVAAILRMPPPVPDLEHDIRLVAWILSNSFEGTIVDRITNPVGIAPQNVMRLAEGYARTMQWIAEGRIAPAKPSMQQTRWPE
jgi:hypothetical protein